MNNQLKSDHYVYRLRYNGLVVYVGEGRANRLRDKYKRPAHLKSIWDNCIVEVVASNLTKRESTEIETEFIVDEMLCNNLHLLNSTTGKVLKHYKYSVLSSVLEVDSSSETNLRWSNTDKVAGNTADGYYPTVCINYSSYLISRVVWVLHNKEDLDDIFVIHHIDGDHRNNNPNNLMKVTYTENNIMRKSRESKDNVGYSKIHKKATDIDQLYAFYLGK